MSQQSAPSLGAARTFSSGFPACPAGLYASGTVFDTRAARRKDRSTSGVRLAPLRGALQGVVVTVSGPGAVSADLGDIRCGRHFGRFCAATMDPETIGRFGFRRSPAACPVRRLARRLSRQKATLHRVEGLVRRPRLLPPPLTAASSVTARAPPGAQPHRRPGVAGPMLRPSDALPRPGARVPGLARINQTTDNPAVDELRPPARRTSSAAHPALSHRHRRLRRSPRWRGFAYSTRSLRARARR